MQVLSPEEMQRFLIQARYDGYFEILLLALTTGMRRGEIMALQWDEDCEALLAEMIVQTKAEIQAAKDKLKSKRTA